VKLLVIPLAIVALFVFLLVLGAIGMAVSMAVLAVLGKLWRIVSGADRRDRRRQQG
jgi:predicted PurR-regulated permease PerM